VAEISEKDQINFKGAYHYGTGRRKSAIARVRLYSAKGNKPMIVVNGKGYRDFFPSLELGRIVESSLKVTSTKDVMAVSAVVRGGGKIGQAEALRHGIARALVAFDEQHKAPLRESGFLTRDPRVKERKKPGLKKARRAPQWQKR